MPPFVFSLVSEERSLVGGTREFRLPAAAVLRSPGRRTTVQWLPSGGGDAIRMGGAGGGRTQSSIKRQCGTVSRYPGSYAAHALVHTHKHTYTHARAHAHAPRLPCAFRPQCARTQYSFSRRRRVTVVSRTTTKTIPTTRRRSRLSLFLSRRPTDRQPIDTHRPVVPFARACRRSSRSVPRRHSVRIIRPVPCTGTNPSLSQRTLNLSRTLPISLDLGGHGQHHYTMVRRSEDICRRRILFAPNPHVSTPAISPFVHPPLADVRICGQNDMMCVVFVGWSFCGCTRCTYALCMLADDQEQHVWDMRFLFLFPLDTYVYIYKYIYNVCSTLLIFTIQLTHIFNRRWFCPTELITKSILYWFLINGFKV